MTTEPTFFTRAGDVVKGVLALVVILLLLVAVPAALVAFAGDPIDDIRTIIDDELLSDDTTASLALRSGLTIVAWLLWAQVALAIVIEVVALGRGRIARRSSFVPGVQGLARRLVVATTLIVNGLTSAGSTALVPLAVPPPVASVELDLLRPLDLDGPHVLDQAAVGGPTYTAAAGDTFWSLAESMLGDGLRWSEIRQSNLGRTMDDGSVITETTEVVRAGWDLVLPADAVLPLTAAQEDGEGQPDGRGDGQEDGEVVRTIDPDAMPEQLDLTDNPGLAADLLGTWNVERGDHFWAIAEDTLTAAYGRPVTDEEITPYWLAIVEANRDRLVTGDPDLIHPGQSFDVLLPPLADGIVVADEELGSLDPSAERVPGGADAESGTGGSAAPSPGAGGAGGRADATTGGADRSWELVGEPGGAEDLVPFEPADDGGRSLDGSTVALGVFGSAVGAGALLAALRRRRKLAAIRRDPGASAATGPAGADRFEARIRPVANTEAVRWLTGTNRYLTRQLGLIEDATPLPAVLAMRAGEFGVELLLDEGCPPPPGFVEDGETGAAWRLAGDLELDAIEETGRGAPPYSPSLLPVGETEAGDLLVDLEQLAVISLVGDLSTIAGWLATLATSVTTMPWSERCSVIAIGVQTVLGGSNQVRVPTDVDAWADETIAALTESSMAATSSTYRRRVEVGADVLDVGPDDGPTIVLLGPGHDDLARRLMAVAELAHSPLVLVTTTALDGHARIELQPGHGVVIPDDSGLRLDFDPIVTGSATVRYAAELLDSSGDRPHFADVEETVRRRPLEPSDDADDPIPHHWPPPTVPSARLSNPEPPADVAGEEPALEPDVTRRSPRPEGPAMDTQTARLRVLEPRPVEARLLTASPSVVGTATTIDPDSEAVLVYLAMVRSATADQLADVFGAGSGHGDAVDRQAMLDAPLAAIAAAVGRNANGTDRVWLDAERGLVMVSDEVASDHRRLVDLVALADRAADAVDEQACLEAAIGLIDGAPGTAGGPRYDWLANDPQIATSIETSVVDAAYRLGELALADGRPEIAAWAATRGLVVVPGQEALHRIQMKAAAARDDRAGVEEAYRAAVVALEALAPWDGLQQETEQLYRSLVDPLAERS